MSTDIKWGIFGVLHELTKSSKCKCKITLCTIHFPTSATDEEFRKKSIQPLIVYQCSFSINSFTVTNRSPVMG